MKNKYARIVFGLPVEGPFDYAVPENFSSRLKTGMRVMVPFGEMKKTGYCIGLSYKTESRYVKDIADVLDEEPLFGAELLKFFKLLASTYFCSWGEIIETALPLSIRKGKRLIPFSGIPHKDVSLSGSGLSSPLLSSIFTSVENREAGKFLIIDDYFKSKRIDCFLELAEFVFRKGKDFLLIIPEISKLEAVAAVFRKKFEDKVVIYHSGLSEKDKLHNWLLMRESSPKVILGSRMAVYSPTDKVGLIIVDDEGSILHKQEEMPFYNTRDVALMRAEFFKFPLILSGPPISVESYYRLEKNKFTLLDLRENLSSLPKINLIDLENFGKGGVWRTYISKPLELKIREILSEGKKTVLFLNRSGFSTLIKCLKCGKVIQCKRCEQNLIYHFDAKILVCHRCGYKEKVCEICPDCNSSYLRYMGMGIEKLESELNRLFPQAKISRLDFEINKDSVLKHRVTQDFKCGKVDILLGTGLLATEPDLLGIDLLGIINLEQGMSFHDFRGQERVFWTLIGLVKLIYSDKGWGEMLIQTFSSKDIIIEAVKELDYNLFYKHEITARRELKLPPFKELIILNLRGKDKKSVEDNAVKLFDILKEKNKNKNIFIAEPIPNPLPKLRDKFRWQILIKAKSVKQVKDILCEVKVLRRRFRGSILTIDMELCL